MDRNTWQTAIRTVLIGACALGLSAFLVWGSTLFADDFDPRQPGWQRGLDPLGKGTWSFGDGQYRLSIPRATSTSWSALPTHQTFNEYCVDVGAKLDGSAVGELGIAFGLWITEEDQQSPSQSIEETRFTTFGVDQAGDYHVGRFNGETIARDIQVQQAADAPNKLRAAGELNRLRVVATTEAVQFFANNELLASAEGVRIRGEVGLYGRSSTGKLQGAFEFIRVMTPNCEE